MPRKRLLITARDPSTAGELSSILPSLVAEDCFDIQILAQSPAYDILTDTNLFSSLMVGIGSDNAEARHMVDDVFTSFKPQIVLSGVSCATYGVDEIALLVAKSENNIPSFVIQSYWGDINTSLGVISDYAFVLDEFAAKKTNELYPSIQTIVSGSLKQNMYHSYDVGLLKEAIRRGLSVPQGSKVLSFFGQNLFSHRYYHEIINDFCDAVDGMEQMHLVYKPHPKEIEACVAWTDEKFSKACLSAGHAYSFFPGHDAISLISASDAVVSLFSTVGFDTQNLLHASQELNAVPVYLFFHPCLRESWVAETNLESIPFSNGDMAIVVEDRASLRESLTRALSDEFTNICRAAVNDTFSTIPENSFQTVLDALRMI